MFGYVSKECREVVQSFNMRRGELKNQDIIQQSFESPLLNTMPAHTNDMALETCTVPKSTGSSKWHIYIAEQEKESEEQVTDETNLSNLKTVSWNCK